MANVSNTLGVRVSGSLVLAAWIVAVVEPRESAAWRSRSLARQCQVPGARCQVPGVSGRPQRRTELAYERGSALHSPTSPPTVHLHTDMHACKQQHLFPPTKKRRTRCEDEQSPTARLFTYGRGELVAVPRAQVSRTINVAGSVLCRYEICRSVGLF